MAWYEIAAVAGEYDTKVAKLSRIIQNHREKNEGEVDKLLSMKQ